MVSSITTVASEAYHDWSGEAAGARLRVNFTLKLLLSQNFCNAALNEIHKFCFQHWSRDRGTCGTGSGAPEQGDKSNTNSIKYLE